ncbi:NADPH dehydrogenase, putative [Candida maltosa Xu316]|uniref:NADPH dehydrogenase, putative n=1 Tax=Candida maltosa (strain Xu316) TaxID=1245528 RepID=M3IQS1_CANMX|nr:NADPH dehydrogenase, putative [Candida maltosa Xu316]
MTISYDVKPSDKIEGAPEVSYYTPQQPVAAGTFHPQTPNEVPPKIFQPLKIGNITLQNRIGVSPMCQYSAGYDGVVTPYHLIHYGSILNRGPGITIVECTAISPEGRSSPEDLGIWNDEQAWKLKEIVDYAHAQKQLAAIQIGHGGRKASTQPLYLHLEQTADESVGGFPKAIVAPSALIYRPNGNIPTPNELTTTQIKKLVSNFGDAARRAVEISGFDAVEIHAAHGYLINEFFSSISNKRTDEYGGSFENRTRFFKEIVDDIKSKIPSGTPIFVRISAVENSPDPESWSIEDSQKLADIFVEKGISLVDVSSGGNDYRQPPRSSISKTKREPIHVPLARAIKQHVGDKLLVATVGNLDQNPELDNKYLESGDFDLVLIGRGFLKNPGLVWAFADKLGVRLHQALQLGWGFWPKKQQMVELIERSSKI